MAKINEKKKINKEKLTEKRMELEKQLKEKLDIGKEKVIDETELMDLLNLMAEIDKTKTTPFIRFLRILKKVFLSTMVHILANSLVMALFSFNLVLENRLMLIPIIIGLSLIFMIGDNIFGLFKLKNIKRKILLYCLYIINIILLFLLMNKYYPVFEFSSIWIFYVVSELLTVFLLIIAIEKGTIMFSGGGLNEWLCLCWKISTW